MINAAFAHCQLLANAVITQIDHLSKLFGHCEPSLRYNSLLNTRVTLNPEVSGEDLGTIGPSVPKSNWLHVDMFRFFFISLRYVLLYNLL